MSFTFPKIYPILDSSFIPFAGRKEFLHRLGSYLAEAGVTLLEYRNKYARMLSCWPMPQCFAPRCPRAVKLILDDRADLVEAIGFDGVHVDAGDLKPAEARSCSARSALWELSEAARRVWFREF